jgi:two-component system, sensor histidine kinase and response regulator
MSKILVIDDDEAFRATLATTLEQQGFDVLQAKTGAQGVQIARTEAPNLILCDVELEGVGGTLVLYAVRRDPQLAAIPFVLMSGFAVLEVSAQAPEKQADGFLAKPFTPAKLTATIVHCLNKRQDTGDPTVALDDASGETGVCSRTSLLDALKSVVEATRIISTAYQQLELKEIVGLATQAHQAASHLYHSIENWFPVAEIAG